MTAAFQRALIVAACLALGACGSSNDSRSFNPAFVREIGHGSQALQHALTLGAGQRPAPGFHALSNGTARSLLRGNLAGVTSSDLDRVEAAIRVARRSYRSALAELGAVRAEVAKAVISPLRYLDFAGQGGFIARWDDYLYATARKEKAVYGLSVPLEGVFDDFGRVVSAARPAIAGGSATRFQAVHRRSVKDIASRVGRFKQRLRQLLGRDTAEQQFIDYVNSSQEAKALIRAVNKEYPRGYLATLRQK